jgi:undecaprenyl-diphosphatase
MSDVTLDVQSCARRQSWPYDLRVVNSLARLPRSVFWLGGAFVLLVVLVWARLHGPADRAVAAILWQHIPCPVRSGSESASVLFAAEPSLLYALAIGVICLRARKPFAAGWILLLLLAGVGLEITFKYYFSHPSPSAFLETLPRAACGPPAPAYPLTIVPTPSTLPSGYSIRAAYFCLLLAALIGGRWPRLRLVAWVGLGALALVAGASRVTVGWHWPSDVVAGLLVGASSAVLAISKADDFAWLGVRGGSGRASGSGRAAAVGRRRGSTNRPPARSGRQKR